MQAARPAGSDPLDEPGRNAADHRIWLDVLRHHGARTIAFSPTVTPGRMVAPAPIQQLRFRCTDLQISASWSS